MTKWALLLVATSAASVLADMPTGGICAHRGDQAAYPENTVPAFVAAVEKGAAMVEFDVHRCKTGELIVMHDNTIDRTTTGHGRWCDCTFEYLRSVDAGVKKGAQFAGTKIPTFDEAIDCFPKDGLWLNVHCDDAVTDEVARKIKAKGRLHQAFIAANAKGVARARAAVPEIKVCLFALPPDSWHHVWTIEERRASIAAALALKAEFTQPHYAEFESDELYAFHAAGGKVNFFWCNTPAQLALLLMRGIDFPLTDNLQPMVAEYRRLHQESCLPNRPGRKTAGAAQARTVMNIVNFVRGCEPRHPELDLVRPIAEEIALNTKYHLPNTILLQYDAMMRSDIMQVVRTAETNLTEYGVWIEMARALVEKCGIPWRGRKGWDWDWFINPGFLMAYTQDERARIVDEIFRVFKAEFGVYPKSVGSWLLDAWSMDYMQRKYDVKGFCICREQDNTDAYGLRGGYFNGLYYPSRKNMLSAAVDMKNAVRAPVFKMLTPDPIYNYAQSVTPQGIKKQVPCTLEPVWHSGFTPAVVDWYFRVYTGPGRLGLSYMQTGQENAFGWPKIGKGLPYQIEQIARYRQAGKIDVERMCDTAARFIREHPANCPQTQVALEDWAGKHKSVWYNSRYYRANLLLDGKALRFRDIHKMCDDFEEPFLNTVCTGWQALYYTPPVVDEYLFKTEGRFEPWAFPGHVNALTVSTPNAETLIVTATRAEGPTIRITFEPTRIVVSGAPDFTAGGLPSGVRKLEFNGFSYPVGFTRTEGTTILDLSL